MPTTRSINDFNQLVDLTSAVEEVPNLYGFVNSLNLFEQEGIVTDTVLFDRTEHSVQLPPSAVRGKRMPSTGKQVNTKTFALPVGFYKDEDQVTSQDIFKARMPGSVDADTVDRVVAQKLQLGVEKFNQLEEYMKIQALKGLVVDSAGSTITNMFTEYGLTQTSIDFELGDATTDIDGKIRQLKTAVTKNAKIGSRVGEIVVLTDPTFFDRLIAHEKIRDVYKRSLDAQMLRADLAAYQDWGITETFSHRGIMFASYDAEFTLSTGSTAQAFAENTGFTVVRGVRGAYKQYAGPHDKLPSAGGSIQAGSKLYAFQYRDSRDEAIEIHYQAAPLVVLRKPQLSVALTSSN